LVGYLMDGKGDEADDQAKSALYGTIREGSVFAFKFGSHLCLFSVVVHTQHNKALSSFYSDRQYQHCH